MLYEENFVIVYIFCFCSLQAVYHTSKKPVSPRFRHFTPPCNTFTDEITSAKLSTYDILNQPRIGEFLSIRIQAVSTTECPQREGGDFWFAILTAMNTTGSTSSQVVDHHNGTYSVDLMVGWRGYVAVDIILVHPSVATKVLNDVTNISDFSRIYWNGMFKKGKKNITTLCNMMYHGPQSWKNKCAYTSERTLGKNTAWVCDQPNNGLNCEHLVSYTTNGSLIGQAIRNISSGMLWLFQG